MGNPAGVRRDFQALERRRFQALHLLEKGLSQSDVARRLGVGQQSVSRWERQAAQGGRQALRRAGRAGRKPQLNEQQYERLRELLLLGPSAYGYATPLWTCQRVARLMEDEFDVAYHPGHVWKILVRLGWSPQRPVGRARERDEKAIRAWKRKSWPAAKKKPAQKDARSSSSTRPA